MIVYFATLQRFEGIYGGKIDKSIAFEEVLVLSSYMCKASQVCYIIALTMMLYDFVILTKLGSNQTFVA